MTEITKRIYGTEFEWPTSGVIGDADTETSIRFAGTLPLSKYIDPEISIINGMLSNGARFYLDLEHFEYATPEESTIAGAVLREFAGERIVMRALGRLVQNPASELSSAYLRKRVIDDAGTTWGYHINLLASAVDIEHVNDDTMHLLALHIATSQPIIGSGTVRGVGDRAYYSFGQKVLDIKHDYNVGTMNTSKALINQRDESLSDRTKYRRIHLTSMDPHISPWAAEMTIGTCSLIVRAIEQGFGDEIRVETDNSYGTLTRLAKRCAIDLTMSEPVYLDGGITTTALGVQEKLIEIVSRTSHTDEEAAILEQWRQAVADLQQNPLLLRDRSDAIARFSLIRSLNVKRGASSNDMSTPFARAADGYYDRVFEIGTPRAPLDAQDPIDSYFASYAHKLRTGIMKDRMPSEEQIETATYNPPTTTRALGRASAIASGLATQVSWDRYLYDGKSITIFDPHEPDVRAKNERLAADARRNKVKKK
jgi:proteasome accessory factor A